MRMGARSQNIDKNRELIDAGRR